MEPDILKDIHVSIPEHCILLSFNSDNEATKFYEWWEFIGASIFLEEKDGYGEPE